MPDDTLLRLRDVSVVRDARAILEHVSLEVEPGEIIMITGPNGAGKSTLVRVMAGIMAPSSGSIWRRPKLTIGYTPQRLGDDLTLPITAAGFARLGGGAPRDRIGEVFAEVGAGRLLDADFASLSGGERDRVVLARALLRDPDLLVLDEPMSGVDLSSQAELYDLLLQVRDRRGCAVVVVTHDLHLVMARADRVICLNRHVCCTGRPHSVLDDPAFADLFGDRLVASLGVYRHDHDHVHDEARLSAPAESDE